MAKVSINLKDGSIEKDSGPEVILGIDLGTTNSLVAYIRDGQPVTIKSSTGNSSLVPSVIHFSENGRPVIGEKAKEFLVKFPDKTI